MKDLVPFEHSDFGHLRGLLDESGNPWFVAADACASINLGNPFSSLALLDDDEKGIHTVDTPGGPQEMTIISEPGLYSLVLRSRKPEAKAFKRWLTHEVIPALRKTGHYEIPSAKPRRADAELNARSTAISLRMMARLQCYPESMKGVLLAHAASLTSGLPLTTLLPPVAGNRDQWLSPTALGERFSIPANTVGKILKSLGLNGKDDIGHLHSQPLSDKSPYSNKEVISYIYDPAVVIPAIERALGDSSEATLSS